MENFNILQLLSTREAQAGSVVKEPACNLGDVVGVTGSIPGSGRSPGARNSKPAPTFLLENTTDRGAWQVTVHGVGRESVTIQ